MSTDRNQCGTYSTSIYSKGLREEHIERTCTIHPQNSKPKAYRHKVHVLVTLTSVPSRKSSDRTLSLPPRNLLVDFMYTSRFQKRGPVVFLQILCNGYEQEGGDEVTEDKRGTQTKTTIDGSTTPVSVVLHYRLYVQRTPPPSTHGPTLPTAKTV